MFNLVAGGRHAAVHERGKLCGWALVLGALCDWVLLEPPGLTLAFMLANVCAIIPMTLDIHTRLHAHDYGPEADEKWSRGSRG